MTTPRASVEPAPRRRIRSRPVPVAARVGALCVAAALAADPAALRAQTEGPPAPAPILAYDIVDGASVPDPLDGLEGDAARGRALFLDAERTGCAVCHSVSGVADATAETPGPSLDGVGLRLSQGSLRLWIVNPRALADAPSKPAYYSLRPFDDPSAEPLEAPRLDAQAVEDLVAFLDGLGRGEDG